MRWLVALAMAAVAAAGDGDASATADRALGALRDRLPPYRLDWILEEGPDPWLVVAELCSRGERDAALAVADRLPRDVWTGALKRYVENWKPHANLAAHRRALAAAQRWRRKCDARRALAALEGVAPPDHDVLSVSVSLERARALRELGRGARSEREFLDTARRAARIGWWAMANHTLRYLVWRHVPEFDSWCEATTLHGLREQEALVELETVMDELVAIVGSSRVVRFVPLGDPVRLGGARRLAAPGAVNFDAECDEYRRALIDPLGLEAGTQRVIVVGEELSAVPCCLLFGQREVAYAISNGIPDRNRSEEEDERGKGILALGGPGGAKVDEARAVGDVVLAEDRARVQQLLGFAKHGKPWRAIHLACRYLPKSQEFDFGDGQRLDWIRLAENLRADLLVLSAGGVRMHAKHSARRAVPKPQGFPDPRRIVERRPVRLDSPVRALRHHGVRQIMVSLWEHDARATRALMARFYELWKPGTSAASALWKAQEFVRGQEKWREPRFWAGWQLWIGARG